MGEQSRYKQCRRFNELGHAHALTFSCFRGRPFFTSDQSKGWMVEALGLAVEKHDFDLWAYVVMPEHVHLLVFPTRDEYSISGFLTTAKQSVSKRVLSIVQQQHPEFLSRMEDHQPNGKVHYRFWQRGGGYDRNISGPDAVFAEIEYMHANPVRRGLCAVPTDWLWSSAREYEKPGSGPLSVQRDSLPALNG